MTDPRDDDLDPLRVGGKFEQFVPLRVLRRGAGELELEIEFVDEHLNPAGMVHGGYITAALDVAIAGGAAATSERDQSRDLFGITLSLTVNFLRPLPAGVYICKGIATGGGKRLKIVEADICARGVADTRYASASGTVKVVSLQAP